MAADLRRELRAVLIKAGLSADDAGTAADACERHMRGRRDSMIKAAIAAGMSTRDAAKAWSLSKTQTHRLAAECTALQSRPIKSVRKNESGNDVQMRAKGGASAPLVVDINGAVAMLALSKRTFHHLVKNGTMPGPIRVSPGRVAWRVKDLVAWVDSRPLVGKEEQAA